MYKVCNMIIKHFNHIFSTKCTVSEISLQLNPIFFMRNFGHFRSNIRKKQEIENISNSYQTFRHKTLGT